MTSADPSPHAPARAAHPLYPVGLVVVAMFSVQFGGAMAVNLIHMVGVLGSVALRLVIAAVVLMLIARPRLRGYHRSDWLTVLAFGVALAAMNVAFFAAIARLPVGVAVTIEFIGPLGLAALLSRHWFDGIAVIVAAAGVVLTSGILTESWDDIDGVGIVLALAAGLSWALYILLSGRTGRRFPGVKGLALAMVVAAVITMPLGLAVDGTAMFEPRAVGLGFVIAMLSSVFPYSLQLFALRHLSARVFGILLSMEPAVAATAGLVVLGQGMMPLQLVGMVLVVLASGAVTLTPKRHREASPQGDAMMPGTATPQGESARGDAPG